MSSNVNFSNVRCSKWSIASFNWTDKGSFTCWFRTIFCSTTSKDTLRDRGKFHYIVMNCEQSSYDNTKYAQLRSHKNFKNTTFESTEIVVGLVWGNIKKPKIGLIIDFWLILTLSDPYWPRIAEQNFCLTLNSFL